MEPHAEFRKANVTAFGPLYSSYLVDPASRDMLVSKIKPCMCRYNLYTGKLRMAR